MKITPKTAKEIAERSLMEAGTYNFEVVNAEDKISRSGNEMIKLSMNIFYGDRVRTMTDYLLDKMDAKLRHFCEATGLLDKYESSTLMAHDCIGRSGHIRIIIREDEEGVYGPKNEVRDYVMERAKGKTFVAPNDPKKTKDDSGDDIPF